MLICICEKIGYVENGVERKIPLEISLRGDKELIYSSTNEEEGRGNAAAVLQVHYFHTIV